MKRLLYSLLDSKSGKFSDVFRAEDDADASRGIIVGLRSGKPIFAQFPDDFSLYVVGHFDIESGLLVSLGTPRHIVAVSTLVSAAQQQEGGK